MITPEMLEAHRRWVHDYPDGVRLVLIGADLRGAYLNGTDLSGANLHGADLRGADLLGADLRDANLSGANLRSANLSCADIRSANLSCADLSGARLGWDSNDLISEVLWQVADTEDRRMLAAYVGRQKTWCWDDWTAWQHPEREWALGVLASWIHKEDTEDDVPLIVWETRKA